MAYVPGFKYDIFISYARRDDAPVPSQERWVSTFILAVKGLLNQMFGRGVDDLNIFLDVESFEANRQIEDLLTAVRQSAIFLAICSPNYEGREWTRAELAAFHAQAQDPARLFAVEKLPLDADLSYPAPLDRHNRIRLWSASEMHGEGTPRSLQHSDPDFERRVCGLVADIKKKLKSMQAEQGGRPAPTPMAVPTGAWRPVLLAQTTDDLDPQRESLRLYLEERGVPVLPRPPATEYPLGGEAFKAAFGPDLDQAAVFVQLLGGYHGKAPPDLPQGFARFQAEAATARKLTMLQWRRPDLQLDTVTNADYRRLLDGPTVAAEDFVSFKERVLRHSEVPRPPPVEPPTGRDGGRKFVFINAHKNDAQIAIRMARALSAEKVESRTPLWNGKSAEVRSSLIRDIRKCNALVVIYGNVDAGWVREQCIKYTEVKRDPASLVAVVMAPPEGKEEADIGVFVPELEAFPLAGDQDRPVLQRVMQKLRA